MHRTQTLLTLTLAVALITSSCARRVVLPAVPPEIPAAIETISKDSTLTPEQKAELIEQAISATERIYQRILDRYESEGKNIKETALQLFTLDASIATLVCNFYNYKYHYRSTSYNNYNNKQQYFYNN